ncbi:MAG: oligosaccharide flippase family protein, partial [Deinococcales bacterium]|nr:oligosaccharide flippase family protein [Chitinophagaceae bacterium]
KEYEQSLYSTTSISIIVSTLLFTLVLWLFKDAIAIATGFQASPKIIAYSILIIAIDTITRIPFAKLRQENRPKRFAFINVFSILIYIFFIWFFINYCTEELVLHPYSWVSNFYTSNTNPVVYIVLANLIQSIITLILLQSEILSIRIRFSTKLWFEMLRYGMPLLIVGLGGIVNETLDRWMLKVWLPGTEEAVKAQIGIYNGCYKLSLLITLFIFAFRMGAEPFFFKEAEGINPQRTYARVMKFFVIIISFIFLVVSLYLPIWKYFLGPGYRVGLPVVPILLLANMFLGIYYNLSVWYKLSNRTIAGTYITLIGVVITCGINYLFIPTYGYIASAWATFFCYGTMMVISFIWGQKEYLIPYAWKKLVAYMVIVVTLFFIHKGLTLWWHNLAFNLAMATLLLCLYACFIVLVEKKELQKLPIMGKFLK